MNGVIPIIIVCGVGIVASFAYIIILSVKAVRRRPPRKRELEIEEDVLTVKLNKRRKR